METSRQCLLFRSRPSARGVDVTGPRYRVLCPRPKYGVSPEDGDDDPGSLVLSLRPVRVSRKEDTSRPSPGWPSVSQVRPVTVGLVQGGLEGECWCETR